MTESFLRYMRPLSLVCVRTLGPYARSSRQAWDDLRAWAAASDLPLPTSPCHVSTYGLLHDDPRCVPPDEQRYDAAVELTPELESLVQGQLPIHRTTGGVHLCLNHHGPYREIGKAISEIRRDPVLAHELTADPRRPVMVAYLDDPRCTPEDKLRATLCLPISWQRDRSLAA